MPGSEHTDGTARPCSAWTPRWSARRGNWPPSRASPSWRWPAAHHRVGGTGGAAARRPRRRRPRRRHALGEPSGGRGARRLRAAARGGPARLGRAGDRRLPEPGRAGQRRRRGQGEVPAARGQRRRGGADGRDRGTVRRLRPDRRPEGGARGDDPCHRRPAEAVDLPDRRHRRHLRGHPAGAGGGAGRRGHHRGDPVHRPVAAGLRARGRHPRGLRGHIRDQGELPAHAGGA